MSEPAGVLDGYLELGPFAKEIGCSPRTVLRWMHEPNGLPYCKIGSRRLIHAATAREWIFSRMRSRNPRPRREGKSEAEQASHTPAPE